MPEKVVPNRQAPAVLAAPALPRFSSPPLASEIYRARVFAEPFVPLPGPSSVDEDRALAGALTAHIRTGAPTDVSRFEAFARTYPGSRWTPSILLGIGTVYRRTGYFTRALESWERSWALLKGESDPKLRALADRAVGELAELNSRLGRYERLESLFAEIGERDVRGPASEKVRGAREGYVVMQKEPERAFRCGPFGIGRILASIRPNDPYDAKIVNATSTRRGTSLRQMLELANSVGLNMQMTRRDPAAPVMTPALVHWRAGHFAALVREEHGRYLLQDPTFGDDLWVSQRALDDEGSGYYLIPAGPLPAGWTAISAAKGDEVWGKGIVGTANPKFQGGGQPSAGGNSPMTCVRMAQYTVNLMLVNLHVWDTPVGYTPPVGPAMEFQVAYNQREVFQPQIPTYSNFGAKWTFDWFAFVQDDPADLSQNVDYYRPGGGLETYTGFSTANDTSTIHYVSRATLVRVSSTRYERRLADGSIEVFAQPDGSVVYPRRLDRTEVIDPQGTHATYAYSYSAAAGGFRLISATDAIGQVTTLSYEASDPLKITKVADPFGRYATFEYDESDRLRKITDVIGLTSEFTYGANDFISSLATPYGTTTFETGQINATAINRWLETTDPLGGKERVEFLNTNDAFPLIGNPSPTGMNVANIFMYARNSYFWDKRAMASMPFGLEYEKASIYHWLHSLPNTNEASGILESEKKPLEGRIWYNYPGQTTQYGPLVEGSSASPTAVGRVLDDGTTQLYRYEYNALGKVTRFTDPVGRATTYTYAANGIDLQEIRQVNGQNTELLQSQTYNSQHRPLTKTDAAGQTTTYTYNTQGQLATITTPPRAGITENRTTTYAYDTNGYLQSFTGPAAGATTSFTYDGYGRRRTATDSEGYVLTYDYDALNRTTKITHPDGTYEQTVYNRLDPQDRRDRRGGWSHTFFDALRRPVAVRDPANRTTTQQWCTCGSLDKIIDASNSATTWERDLQGRVTKETRADSSFQTFTYETTTSRIKTRTDAKGQVTTYTYLLDDNLGQTVYTNATIATPTVSLTYDPIYNRLFSMTDGTGTTNYSYYAITVSPTLGAGKLQAVDGPLTNDTVSYGYDERGRVATRGLSAFSTTTSYDVLGRPSSLTSPIGSFAWTYLNTTGRPQTVTYPNGQVTTYSYFNNVGDKRLQQIKHQQTSGGTVLSQFDYTYDAVGNISTWQQQLGATGAKVYNLGYDAADQLSSAVQKDASTQQILKNYGYAYDAAGNRTVDAQDSIATTSQYNNRNELTQQAGGAAMPVAGTVSEPATVTVSGTPASVNATNQFAGAAQVGTGTQNFTVVATDPSGNTRTNTYQVNVSGTTQSLLYDANGNLCARGGTTCANGTTIYEWDAENRLVDAKQGATTLASFVYDGTGRRVQKTSGGVTDSFIYDGQNVVQERLSSGQTVDYVQGTGIDRTLAQRDQAGVVTYYLADHLGSISQTTTSAGVVALTREYDPWGNLLQGATTGGYAFTGREWDPETGLYNYRARYYEPKMARFASEDPTGLSAGSNLFAYVENNPTGWVDPLGHVKDHPRPRHPPRDCNAVEMEDCKAQCGSKGVQSCKRAETFRGRLQDGVMVYEWVEGPMSCSCNDTDDDDNYCKKNPGTCALVLILGVITLFCTGPKLGPMSPAPAMAPPIAPNLDGGA